MRPSGHYCPFQNLAKGYPLAAFWSRQNGPKWIDSRHHPVRHVIMALSSTSCYIMYILTGRAGTRGHTAPSRARHAIHCILRALRGSWEEWSSRNTSKSGVSTPKSRDSGPPEIGHNHDIRGYGPISWGWGYIPYMGYMGISYPSYRGIMGTYTLYIPYNTLCIPYHQIPTPKRGVSTP